MIQYQKSADFAVEQEFPERRLLAGLEGGSIWLAEKHGKYYVILLDERAMAGFLIPGEDDDLSSELVKIYEFAVENERERYLQ